MYFFMNLNTKTNSKEWKTVLSESIKMLHQKRITSELLFKLSFNVLCIFHVFYVEVNAALMIPISPPNDKWQYVTM